MASTSSASASAFGSPSPSTSSASPSPSTSSASAFGSTSSASVSAFASPAPYPSANSNHDVFINHRGPDTKKTFASHLYHRLLAHGITAFLDQNELQQGEGLTCQIENAIHSASVHVAIFSSKYAESAWCLRELVLMQESKSPIIPVFYHVKPADLRWTKGTYAQDLEKLKNSQRYDAQDLEKWTKALSNVPETSGFELEAYNGDEGELLNKVVERVLKKVRKPPLDVGKYPTGLDDKVNDLENTVLLHPQHSGEAQILGIVGLGGVGKTTLAKQLFNKKCSNYSKTCFLPNVRDHAGKGSLISLQRTLLKILTGSDVNSINSVDEGIGMLRKHLSFANALIIIDDVDHEDQVNALWPHQTVLHSKILILITSRNMDVVRRRVENTSIYKLTGLKTQHSRELFCCHAFSQSYPLPGFESLVEKFLKTCNGLPLSLKVFGSLFYGKYNDKSYWQYVLDELKVPSEIQNKLKISYDSLTEGEQQIFLDIACFFIGEDRDMASRIWESGLCGFQNLQDKCLVEVNSENKIEMHDHLRDLGRDIAKEPGLPRRLWRWTDEDIDDLTLQQSSLSAIPVRGIKLLEKEYNEFADDDALGGIRMRRLQLLDTEGVLLERILTKQSPNLLWLRWDACAHSSLPSWISMKNLKVLYVEGELETLWENESQAPLQLRELEIRGPLSNIPKSIGQLKHLEQIRLDCAWSVNDRQRPMLTKLPEEFCLLQSLKVLVLRECFKMKSLPECFGNLTNLQHIDLYLCRALERLPDSFGKLIKLQYLNLDCCKNLTMSSETLGNISTLEYINLSQCSKINVFPQQVARQRSLEQLWMRNVYIKELPSAIGALSDLEVLNAGGRFLETLPSSLCHLKNLKKLQLYHCKHLKCLPASIQCPLKKKGETWSDLDSSIDNCILPRLQEFTVYGAWISNVSFAEGVCSNLRHLSISDCSNVVEVGTLPNSLTYLSFARCSNLRKIDQIYGLAHVQELSVSGCKELEELPGMETLVSLSKIWAYDCVKLKRIKGVGQLTKLRCLDVSRCRKLEEVEGIEDCMSLESLDVGDCARLEWSEGVVEQLRQRRVEINLSRLQHLSVSGWL